MNNGFALAGIGSTESIVAAATVYAAHQIDAGRWVMGLGRELARTRGSERWLPNVAHGLGIGAVSRFKAKEVE